MGAAEEGPVESGADAYAPPYVNGWLGAAAAQHRALSSVLCGDLAGWGGAAARGAPEREIYVYIKLINIIIQQKLRQPCKAIILQ